MLSPWTKFQNIDEHTHASCTYLGIQVVAWNVNHSVKLRPRDGPYMDTAKSLPSDSTRSAWIQSHVLWSSGIHRDFCTWNILHKMLPWMLDKWLWSSETFKSTKSEECLDHKCPYSSSTYCWTNIQGLSRDEVPPGLQYGRQIETYWESMGMLFCRWQFQTFHRVKATHLWLLISLSLCWMQPLNWTAGKTVTRSEES